MSTDPELVKALLFDARDACGLVLTLMEQMLHLDPEKESREISVLNGQVAAHLPDTRIAIENLRKTLAPWPERRAELSSAVADEVDRFFVTLEKGLAGLQSQANHRIAETQAMIAQVQEEMKGLRNRSNGLQGYRGRIDVNPMMLNRKI
jgi:hypothetical protein